MNEDFNPRPWFPEDSIFSDPVPSAEETRLMMATILAVVGQGDDE